MRWPRRNWNEETKTEWDECKFPFPREGQKCGWGFNDLNPNLERGKTMYFTDDSLLPENQAPLMITAAPYGPMWMPGDCTPEQKLPVTWEEQTQIAVDCYNAGATLLHIHVRDPKTGHISKNFKEYADQIGRLRKPCRR